MVKPDETLRGPRTPDGRAEFELQPLFRKLKPGPGLSAEAVREDQRLRLRGAMVALVGRAGLSGVRVRSLARTAGVSTSTFYKHFVNTDECLAETYEFVVKQMARAAVSDRPSSTDWRDCLRAVVTSLMGSFASEPREARLVLLDIFGSGPVPRKRIGPSVGAIEQALAMSFDSAPRPLVPPRHLIAAMTSGLLQLARRTVLLDRSSELPALAGELAEWMVALPHPQVLSLAQYGGRAPGPRRESHPFPFDKASPEASVLVDERGRLLSAAVKLATTEGLPNVKAPKLRFEAGVSRSRFDACFKDLDECLLEAIETVGLRAVETAFDWSQRPGDWKGSTCRLALALCAQAARDRTHARLVLLGHAATGEAGLLRREVIIGRLANRLQETVPPDCRPTRLVAEASLAATWHIAQLNTAAGRTPDLPSISPLLSYLVLGPIVGSENALSVIGRSFGSRTGTAVAR